MPDAFFLTVNQWMTGSLALAGIGCFIWGMISVLFSPCHLASIPLIVAYVGGQKKILTPGEASLYSLVFTLGLFITIALIGVLCALLGRMLGDVGNYWQILVGLILIWVALGMLEVAVGPYWIQPYLAGGATLEVEPPLAPLPLPSPGLRAETGLRALIRWGTGLQLAMATDGHRLDARVGTYLEW